MMMPLNRTQEITQILEGIERYNPDSLNCLERYLEDQVSKQHYDLEANLALLKLYQFTPSLIQIDYVVNILLKALTALPRTDFIMCKCLIDFQSIPDRDSQVKQVMELHNLLETCQFKDFWNKIQGNRELWSHIGHFEASIRSYVSDIINITYQNIEKDVLKELLGFNTEAQLTEWMKNSKWHTDIKDPSLVFVNNQEENIKTKNITEKIDFENVAPIVAAYR